MKQNVLLVECALKHPQQTSLNGTNGPESMTALNKSVCIYVIW